LTVFTETAIIETKSPALLDTVSFNWLTVTEIILDLLQIYKCDEPNMPKPQCYTSRGSVHPDEFPCDYPNCKGKYKLVRWVLNPGYICCEGKV